MVMRHLTRQSDTRYRSRDEAVGRDRYRYVIELGHTPEPLGEAAHNESDKVRGCVSQV
jgi:sulfur transfer protein SufE